MACVTNALYIIQKVENIQLDIVRSGYKVPIRAIGSLRCASVEPPGCRTSNRLDTGEVGPFSSIDGPARVPMELLVGLGITSDTMDKASISSRGSYDRQSTLRVCRTSRLQNEPRIGHRRGGTLQRY